MTDEKTRQLENRIDTLESKIEKMMPSRRDALKMGGAALVGGAAMSGTASAGTNQRGTIGDKDATPPQLVDLHSEDINNADTITTDTLNAQGVDAVSVNRDITKITNLPTSAGEREEYQTFENNKKAADHIQVTDVGTSRTTICTRSANTGRAAQLTQVVGTGPSEEGFASLIHWSQRGGNLTVLSDIDINGSPATRSYDTPNFVGQELSMSSDTYQVVARSLETSQIG